ncbi:MAG: glycosyltransferase family 1 protein [Pirellulales bacterium]
MSNDRPIRVLHILGSLDRGGAETWLVNALRRVDRRETAMDFLVHTAPRGAYEDEVEKLGARVVRCLNPQGFWRYSRNFKALLKQHGPYDVIHSHVHHYSGHILRVARKFGVPVRIAHSHNDTSRDDDRAGTARRAYLALMRYWIARDANVGLAASGKAATSLFGSNWKSDPRRRILFCGVDLNPLRESIDRDAVRAEFGFTPDDFVVGHVGRFDEQKNHSFLITAFACFAATNPNAKLLLVGQGPLRHKVEALVEQAGLRERVIFAGVRPDVQRLMRGAMDLFVMPSWFEGLPLVLVEAQAAGLSCLVSDVIADETTLVESLISKFSLERSPNDWAAAMTEFASRKTAVSKAEALEIVTRSPLNIDQSAQEMCALYRSELLQEPNITTATKLSLS